jgi:hypothetical protein
MGRRARLQTSGGVTAAGPAANPRFFTGFVVGAEQVAAGLLAVATVAQARYYQPQRAGLRDPRMSRSPWNFGGGPAMIRRHPPWSV